MLTVLFRKAGLTAGLFLFGYQRRAALVPSGVDKGNNRE